MEININNIINVNISSTPELLGSDNINTIAVFTKEQPIYPINDYVIYKNPNSCMQDWGSESTTYKMVNCIFSQNLNITAGGGYVVVIPMLKNVEVEATEGKLISENCLYSKWKKVKDGSISISVDGGEEKSITGLDFSNINSLKDVAEIIQNAFNSNGVNANIIEEENKNIIIKSKTKGDTSSIILASNTTGTDLSTVDYFNINQAIIVGGEEEYTGIEQLHQAVSRSLDYTFYECIITAFKLEDREILKTAQTIQPLNKIFITCIEDLQKAKDGEIADTIYKKGYNKTRILYNGMGEGLLFVAGYSSKLLSVNFKGNGTALNLHTKEIIGIVADTTINDNILIKLNNKGIDCYPCVKGLGVIYCSGKNDWVDTILFLNWLKMALETAGFNRLRGTLTKIPQTDQGIELIANSYVDVLEQAKKVGYIGAGKWNLSFTFGNQSLFYSNIEQVGYYLYNEPISSQNQEDRENRKAPLIQIAIKLIGAINSSDVLVYVNN